MWNNPMSNSKHKKKIIAKICVLPMKENDAMPVADSAMCGTRMKMSIKLKKKYIKGERFRSISFREVSGNLNDGMIPVTDSRA